MDRIYVIDTCAVISYFSDVFKEPSTISRQSKSIISKAFQSDEIKLIFPGIVFIEIFKLYFKTDEWAKKIRYEVLTSIEQRGNMEVRPLDKEILENFIKIIDIEPEHKFDNHDKQILATAMSMSCPLITSDTKLIRYNFRKNIIPKILN